MFREIARGSWAMIRKKNQVSREFLSRGAATWLVFNSELFTSSLFGVISIANENY